MSTAAHGGQERASDLPELGLLTTIINGKGKIELVELCWAAAHAFASKHQHVSWQLVNLAESNASANLFAL